MKKILLIAVIILGGLSAKVYGQADSTKILFDSAGVFIGKPDSLPSFKGGISAWTKFLQRNLNTMIPLDKGAPKGGYTTIISFIVDENGNMSDFKIEQNPGYGVGEEALRAMKLWAGFYPAIYNGKAVKYRHQEKITFQVSY